MADNVEVTQGSGTTLRTVEISNVHYPVYLIATELQGSTTIHNELVPVPVTIPGSLDAFGRIRTSDPETIFDSKLLYDKKPLYWDESITGVGASSVHSTVNCEVTLTVTNSGESVIRQTKMRFNYQPAKSQLVFITGKIGPDVLNTSRIIGLYDGTDGIYFKLVDSALSVCIKKNGAESSYAQADWNIDKMDGTGISGITVNVDYNQIFIMDFEWLGVGQIRWGFVIGGKIYYCHKQNFSNTTGTGVYMSTPNLPIRYEITSTGGTGTMSAICSSIISEGGKQEHGIIRSGGNGATTISLSSTSTIYALYGIKLKSTHLDATVILQEIDVLCNTQNNAVFWSVRLNPTVVGTFTYSDITNSVLQEAIGTTANTVTGGTILNSGYTRAGSLAQGLNSSLRLGSTIAGVSDTIVICAQPINANSATGATIAWRELL